MKWVAVVLVLLVLLAGCAMLAPFTQKDFQQIGKILRSYTEQWEGYDYTEIHLQMGREGWIGFLWLDEERAIQHILVLVYFDGHWTVVREE